MVDVVFEYSTLVEVQLFQEWSLQINYFFNNVLSIDASNLNVCFRFCGSPCRYQLDTTRLSNSKHMKFLVNNM